MIESKSLLAKLMATENLTIEQRKVSTASFNVKERVLTIPFLDNGISAPVMDLFMGHEVGHALYTPLEGLMGAKEKKLIASILNVVEDSRIERKIQKKYPGLKNSFVKAYNELVEKDFFGTKDKDINTFNFIDRVNLHCKGGATLAIKFNDEEQVLLQAVESTERWEDVEEVTKRIIDFMKIQQQEEEKRRGKAKVKEDDDGESEEVELEEGNEPNEDGQGENDASETDEADETDEDSDEREDDTKLPGTLPGTEGSDDEIRSHTDDAYRKNESKLFSTDNLHYVYMNIPKFDIKEGIWDYKSLYKKYAEDEYQIDRKEFSQFRRESSKVVSYLVKEFELRKNADQLKRASISKTGDLNLNKIFSYQFSEDIFKKITVVPGGKSHGLIMYLDWSGSMAQHIGNTVKQLLNLVMFCKKVNIPFEVYAFIEDTHSSHLYRIKPKEGDVITDNFCLLNLLSSRMSAAEFMTAGGVLMHISGIGSRLDSRCYPDFMRMGGTPLNEAVISAMEIVPAFQKKNKLQVVNTVFLTDGDGSYLNSTYDAIGRRDYIRDTAPKGSTTRIIFRDPVTKHEQTYDDYGMYGSLRMRQTSALIKLLKLRTNSHVIGFFVGSARDIRNRIGDFYPELGFRDIEIKKEEFRTSKYLVVNSSGFDDYYVLRSSGLDTDEGAEFEVKENATTRGLVSAFNKYAGNRINNRVILNRFIGLIS